ncbi:MAG TPA: helix-turn-helix transcriptional regulator [Nitrososphaera sp.]|nr:helix-turn-helix transcriptional regulator [Nitrososphaera sp.]
MAHKLAEFGSYLKQARADARIESQNDAVEALNGIHVNVSQSLIAQYETGRITDPDLEVLLGFSKIYKKDYMEILWHLVKEKYAPPRGGWSEFDAIRWELWKTGLVRWKEIARVKELEKFQLQAKAALFKEKEVLNLPGVLKWTREFPDLKQLWVVAPNFLDDEDVDVFETVCYNIIKRNVTTIYFVTQADTDKGGRFWSLKERFSKKLGKKAIGHIHGVPLTRDALTWIQSDIVVANPHQRAEAIAFQYFRRHGRPTYAIRMDDVDVKVTVELLSRWATTNDSDFRKLQERFY